MLAYEEKYDPELMELESLEIKFLNLAKEHFQFTIKQEYDYLNSVKESIKFYALDIPAEIKEIFIPYQHAPVFWIYDSNVINQIEDFLKFNLPRGKYLDTHKVLKDNYAKWVTTRLKSEREFHATAAINLIERDIHKHNFFKLILNGVILTYHHSLYNPSKALELFNNAREIIKNQKLSEQAKTDLDYIINLYKGFVYLKEKDYSEANKVFKECQLIRKNGITSKLYQAVTEIKLGNLEEAGLLVKDIIDFDLLRLSFAMNLNNAPMFNYFIRNAFVYNIFYEKDLSLIAGHIEHLLRELRSRNITQLELLGKKIENLRLLQYEEFFTPDINAALSFIEKIAAFFNKTNNTLFLAASDGLERRFQETIDLIVAVIKEKLYNEIKIKLQRFDESIHENIKAENQLQTELENFREKTRTHLNKTLQQVNETYDYEIKLLEEKISGLYVSEKFDPKASFSSNMIYNLVVALAVFIIGSVAGYSNRSVSDVSEFNSIFSYLLLGGLKWGIISLLVGTLISAVVAGLVLFDRADEKQRLVRKINHYKIQRERIITEQKEYAVQKEKMMEESIKGSINQLRNRNEEIKRERDEQEKELIKEADKKIEEMTGRLEAVVFGQ